MKLITQKNLKIGISCLCFLIIIGFVEKRHENRVCRSIIVHLNNQLENYFIADADIRALVTENGVSQIIGVPFKQLHLKSLENRVEEHKYVQQAEVYKDLTGNLIVRAEQSMPVARIIQEEAPEAYISATGEILPVSDRYTARVMLISGAKTEELIEQSLETDYGRKIFEMVNFIDNHNFWKAQVAQINIMDDGELKIYPQVGKQYIEFGDPDKIQEKFKKLRIFYKEILPRKGWNNYERVNIKYNNQIVCE